MEGKEGDKDNPFLLLGPVKVTGKDLLYRVEELVYRQGGNRDLCEEHFLDNVPGMVRYRQILELFHIFEIRTEIARFCSGIFLRDRNPQGYDNLIAAMVPKHKGCIMGNMKMVADAFNLLFSYKYAAKSLLKHCSGILTGGYGTIFAYQKLKIANITLKDEMEKIDDTLWEMIDPAKKAMVFNMPHEKYKYLAYDLDEIDIAYM